MKTRAHSILPAVLFIAVACDSLRPATGDGASGAAVSPGEHADALEPAPGQPPAAGLAEGIWISPDSLAALPTEGAAWDALEAASLEECGVPDLSDQDQRTNVCVLAKALVFARTGDAAQLQGVLDAIRALAAADRYEGRALALGRELAAYVIAADLIRLRAHDAVLDRAFRERLRTLRVTPTTDGPRNLVECHEQRPNNWGTHCGASRAAVAVYLGDRAELERTARVFRGYLGDRAAYDGFRYGADLSWQCDPDRPVGVNPAGCAKQGRSLDGVLPDDQRRGGSFEWPPPQENYVWEALQGALALAVILQRQGYDAFAWQDRALLRAAEWLHEHARFPAEGDDTWSPHLLNRMYGTAFPAPVPSRPGKNVGWTDWTHASASP